MRERTENIGQHSKTRRTYTTDLAGGKPLKLAKSCIIEERGLRSSSVRHLRSDSLVALVMRPCLPAVLLTWLACFSRLESQGIACSALIADQFYAE